MIAIASDHAGYPLKEAVKAHLEERGLSFHDFGSFNGESCDYPMQAKVACKSVADGECDKALLFCGTGIGISMAANKVRGIRAACCSDYFSAKYTRLHNDANVLCMGARVIGTGTAIELVDVFLDTSFEGGRHARRVNQIAEIETEYSENKEIK
jgi:ribose 5-phosphate isomerase B